MQYISWIADFLAIATTIFALGGWLQSIQVRKILEDEKKNQNQKINIVIKTSDDKHSYPLKIQPRRAELTRAEVLGLLGMIPLMQPTERFHLKYISTPDFFKQLDLVKNDPKETVLNIMVSEEEFNQFDYSNETSNQVEK
jgi:hypothetical protein